MIPTAPAVSRLGECFPPDGVYKTFVRMADDPFPMAATSEVPSQGKRLEAVADSFLSKGTIFVGLPNCLCEGS